MKTIKIYSILLFLAFTCCGSIIGQQQKANKLPMTADQVVKAIDKEVKLSEEQKNTLRKRAITIIEGIKAKPQIVTDSTRITLQRVLDSVLTIEQKEIMRINRDTRCGDAVKKYIDNNNSKSN